MRPTGGGLGLVQADVAELQQSVVLGIKKFETWDQFTAWAIEGPAGVWTFDRALEGAGTIIMPAGARVIGGESATIGAKLPAGLSFIADVDGPAFSGPLICSNMFVVQQSAGLNARGWDISTSAGRVPILTNCVAIGGRVGFRAEDIVGLAAIDNCLAQNNDVGYEVRGAIGALALNNPAAAGAAPTFIAFVLDASAVVTGSVGVTDAAFILSAGTQFGFALSHASTFSPGILIQISGAANTGPQANTFRQTAPGVTDMASDDERLVVKGCPSEPNWAAVGVASRIDLADPIIVAFSGTDTDTPIPYEDPGANLEIVAAQESHFSWFKDGGDVDNSYWEYTGAIGGASATLFSDIMHDRASGTGNALIRWQKNDAPGYAGWVAVPDSEAPFENTNAKRTRSAVATSPGVALGDRFRPVVQNNADTVSLRLQDIKLQVRISS